MNPDEIATTLRHMAENSRSKHDVLVASADLLESQQARITELEDQFAASQREKQAAVEDIEFLMRNSGERGVCKLCTHDCIINSRVKPKCDAKWRGPQEAGKGEAE